MKNRIFIPAGMVILNVLSVFAAESPLTLSSGNAELNEGFRWAKEKALSYVATGRPGVPYPCYQGSYAHDLQYCIRDISHQAEAGHLLGLREENFSMLRRFAETANRNNDNCRRHWPVWKFEFGGASSTFTPELPTPFELAERAYEQYLWSGERRWIDDDTFTEFFRYTNSELVNYLDANKNGVVDIANIKKNCNDGLASYWEFPEKPSNEAGDAIGAQYQSYLGYSKILDAKGLKQSAEQYRLKAQRLQEHFEKEWYSDVHNRYISGFLADGSALTDWAHEQSFFILLKRITDMGERTRNYIDFVHSNTYNQGINIEATTYYPEAFYHHHANHLGWHWLLYDLRSRDIYPEVSYLIIRNTICGLMGVSGNAPASEVTTLPRLVREIPWVESNHIPVGENDIKVRHDGCEKTTLRNNAGKALIWNARFYGSFNTLMVNGTPVDAEKISDGEAWLTQVSVPVAVGEEISVEIPQEENKKQVFLSDLAWETVSDPVKVRKDAAATGYVLTMGKNITFEKGIGMLNSQDVTYNLGGKYQYFEAELGTDMAKKSNNGAESQNGSVICSVFADGEEIFTSGELSVKDAPRKVFLEIAGKKQLKLVTRVSANGKIYTDWGNAVLKTTPGAYLHLENKGIGNDDNKDGLPDPGESFDILLSVSNLSAIASSTQTSVSCKAEGESADYLTIHTPAFELGSLAGKSTVEKAFRMTLDPQTPRQTRFNLIFTLTDGDNEEVVRESFITPYPILEMQFEGTNNNSGQYISAGEEGQFILQIANTGKGISRNLTLRTTATGSNAGYLTLPQKTTEIFPVEAEKNSDICVAYKMSESIGRRQAVNVLFELYEEERKIQSLEKRFTVPYSEYKVTYLSLTDTNNKLSMISRGATSELKLKIENTGNREGDKTFLTIRPTGSNAGMILAEQTSFEGNPLLPGETEVFTIPLKLLPNADKDAVYTLEMKTGDKYSETKFIKSLIPERIYCSDMPFNEGESSLNDTRRDTKTMSDQEKIRLNNKTYTKGLGTHSYSAIVFDLNKRFLRFSSDVGVDQAIIVNGSCNFIVRVDGVERWNSGKLVAGGKAASCEVDVAGADKLELITTDGDDGANSDHASWGDAMLTPDLTSSIAETSERRFTLSATCLKAGQSMMITSAEADFDLTLGTTSGKVILREQVASDRYLFRTEGLSTGIYFITLSQHNKPKEHYKIVIIE